MLRIVVTLAALGLFLGGTPAAAATCDPGHHLFSVDAADGATTCDIASGVRLTTRIHASAAKPENASVEIMLNGARLAVLFFNNGRDCCHKHDHFEANADDDGYFYDCASSGKTLHRECDVSQIRPGGKFVAIAKTSVNCGTIRLNTDKFLCSSKKLMADDWLVYRAYYHAIAPYAETARDDPEYLALEREQTDWKASLYDKCRLKNFMLTSDNEHGAASKCLANALFARYRYFVKYHGAPQE